MNIKDIKIAKKIISELKKQIKELKKQNEILQSREVEDNDDNFVIKRVPRRKLSTIKMPTPPSIPIEKVKKPAPTILEKIAKREKITAEEAIQVKELSKEDKTEQLLKLWHDKRITPDEFFDMYGLIPDLITAQFFEDEKLCFEAISERNGLIIYCVVGNPNRIVYVVSDTDEYNESEAW